jgi:hypothetical protein
MLENNPSFCIPNKKVVSTRITEDAKNNVFMFELIVIGNVGVPQFAVGRYTANNENNQRANMAERRR